MVLFRVFNDLYSVDCIKHNISNLCKVHGLYNLSTVILYTPSALSVGLPPLVGWGWGFEFHRGHGYPFLVSASD